MTGFLLARPDSVVRGTGVRAVHRDPWQAAAALREGAAPAIAGALPFDPRGPAALVEPGEFLHTAGPWRPAALPELPRVRAVVQTPGPAEHRARVARLVRLLEDPGNRLRKVVAARSVLAEAASPLDPEVLAGYLSTRHPRADIFAVDLTPAGREGATLIGASPELLVHRRGTWVELYPLAGTLPRLPDHEADTAQAEILSASAKNHAEHAFVVDWIAERLSPVCTGLSIPRRPKLVATHDMWHLGTPIHGILREPAPNALELALLLHPTPAVCGTPTADALEYITGHEEDRGFYGGAVGWCDAAGDGTWVVAIRSAELAAGGQTLRAHAGGGIVAASDPHAELAETTVKLRTLLGALDCAVPPDGE
ncbi:isochorismate synthase [Nocardia jinanensis]|uniref:Isochorismate synthase MenF n=1 Tax=Nocardia jinanensis TaxID=382504 RepID=A0A917RY46_9NOCA|nr:chorismate-binding protein [Nocardia jinanensis]GGL42133.1 putative isochorismate synthase MenF [Nocardia jinanensis]